VSAMPIVDPMHRQAAHRGFAARTRATVLLAGAALVGTFLVSVFALPRQLVLPVVCLAALAMAAAAAFIAWRSGALDQRHPTYWDIAGALAFIGMSAAILSEPDQVFPLLEVATKDD
jgi:hypothetical protein